MADATSPTGAPPRIDRREVLARAAALAAGAGISLAWVARAAQLRAEPGRGGALTDPERTTMAAVQETLWPAGEGVPGARDLHATDVLDAALASPDTPPIELVWVRNGIESVHGLARVRGVATFEALSPADREAVLVAFREKDEGQGWLRIVLGYTLEAVLGDPVHGGNPGEIGWKWAGYEPADLRPPR